MKTTKPANRGGRPKKIKRPAEPIVGLAVDQVAARLQVHPVTVRALLHSGQLQGRKIGKAYRVHPSSIDEFLLRKPPERAPATDARKRSANGG
jgi:excisionase family DNA binding protein